MPTINICLFEDDIVMMIVERFFTWEDNVSKLSVYDDWHMTSVK